MLGHTQPSSYNIPREGFNPTLDETGYGRSSPVTLSTRVELRRPVTA